MSITTFFTCVKDNLLITVKQCINLDLPQEIQQYINVYICTTPSAKLLMRRRMSELYFVTSLKLLTEYGTKACSTLYKLKYISMESPVCWLFWWQMTESFHWGNVFWLGRHWSRGTTTRFHIKFLDFPHSHQWHHW